MHPNKLNPWLTLAVIGGLAYPFMVYAGINRLPPAFLVMAGLALIGARLLGLRSNPDIKLWAAVFAIAALLLIGGLFFFPAHSAEAYPVIVSLSVAAIFGMSLMFPPTIVERIARLNEPNLPAEGVIYTRRVTIVWTLFLVTNAAISASLAVWGTLGAWTLWNGLISYLLMGILFIGELIVRKRVRR